MESNRLLQYLEEYIFSKDKESTIAKLLPDTDEHTYFTLTYELNKNRGAISNEVSKAYKRLIDDEKNGLGGTKASHGFKKGIRVRKMLYQLAHADSEKDRKDISRKISEVLQIRHGHKRPKIAEGMAAAADDRKKLDSFIRASVTPATVETTHIGEKNYINEHTLGSIKPGYLLERDLDPVFKMIIDKSSCALPHIINRLPTLSNVKNLIKHIVNYFKKDSSPNREMIFKKLTQSQMLALGNEYKDLTDLTPSFVDELYHKSFPEHTSINKIKDITVLKKIFLWSLNSKLTAAYPGIKRKILRILLNNLWKQNSVDPEFFEEFIKNPSSPDEIFSKKVTKKWTDDYISFSFLKDDDQNVAEIVTGYLRLMNGQGADIARYSEFFNSSYFSKLQAEFQLKNGERVEKVLEIFTKTELDFLNEEKYMNFAEKKTDFLPGEKVSLVLEVKNIKKLSLKLFEINTANYTREIKENPSNDVKLDGLVSISEKTFYYQQPTIVAHKESFVLEEGINNKRGVFVADFIGEGTGSRAIIRKGYLTLIHTQTRTGYSCKILDEQFNVCKGENTGLYLEDKFYKAAEDGSITFEYRTSNTTYSIILQHEGFCYVVKQELKQESVSFSSSWLYSEESFLPGNKSTILLKTSMLVSGIRVPLANLKETKVEIEFLRSKNVKSYQKFENLSLKDDQDIQIEFYLPNNTGVINLKTEYTFTNLNGQSESRNFNFTITLKDREGNAGKTHLFLRREEESYYLYHLGKNGEPISGTELDVSILYIWKRDRETSQVVTDEKGRVKLGLLNGVTLVEAAASEVKNENLSTYFKLWNPYASMCISELIIIEGESVQFPVLSQYESSGIEAVIHQVNKSKKTVIEDFSQNISKIGGFYTVDKLPKGDYVFRYTKSEKKVDLYVVHNARQINDELIQSGNTIFKTEQKTKLISNILSESFEKTSNTLELSLDKHGPNTRVHLFSQTFIEEGENKDGQIIQTNSSSVTNSIKSIVKVENQKVSYLQDRQLAGEMIYAMNRRMNEPAIGTTSEKPSLFLKRQEIRDTHYKTDQVTNGGDFEQDSSSGQDSDQEIEDYKYQERKRPMKKKGGRGNYGGQSSSNDFFTPSDDYFNNHSVSATDSCRVAVHDKIRHFLKTPSTAIVNLKPDSQGKVKVLLEGVQTRSLRVFVINGEESTFKTINLGDAEEVPLVDLRLKEASDPNKAFAYEREVYKVMSGEKQSIPGFNSCEYELIDSVEKLMSIKMDLSSNLGSEWDFLKNWHSLKIGQKLKVVDEMFSYELALFLFKKDREFFDMSLREFTLCKMQKSIIDYYLLEDKEALKGYLQSNMISKLNTLEKICLLDALPELKLTDILTQLQGEDSLNTYEGPLLFTKIFDRIVSSADKKGEKVEVKKKDKALDYGEYDDDFCVVDNDYTPPQSEKSEISGDEELQSLEEEQKYKKKEEEDVFMEQRYCEEEENMNYDLFGHVPCEDAEEPIQQQRKPSNPFIQQTQNTNTRLRAPRGIQRGRRSSDNDDDNDDDGESECEDGNEEDEDFGGEEEEEMSVKKGATYDLMNLKKRRPEPNVTKLQQSGMKTTKEYRDIGYYYQKKDQSKYKIQANLFWVDLARYILSGSKEPFLSENFIYVDIQHLPFVIAFIQLPQQASQTKFTTEGTETHIELSGGNGLLFLKYLKEREAVPDNSQTILAAQKWFDRDERFEYNIESGQQEEKHIDYFIKGKIYGSQVVVSNVSSVEQQIQVITEIPRGALPVILNDYHQSHDFKLNQFSTNKFEFFFYFPQSGDYSYCAACVTRDGRKVAVQGSPSELKVLDEHPKKADLKSIKDILAQGSKEDILNFMKKENINNEKIFKFTDIYWLLKDEEFYKSCIQILRDRLIYDHVVWSYAYLHGDIQTVIEMFRIFDEKQVASLELNFFDSYSQTNKFELRSFRFLEYHPIANARFHQLSKEKVTILNQQFFDTYLNFLKYYFEKEDLVDDEDKLILTYYLLLQDRIDDALLVFNQIASDSPAIPRFAIQYDYMNAYFDLYKGMPLFTKAKTICEKYLDYSVMTWRTLFIEMANQLAEVDGEGLDADDEAKKKEVATSDAPVLRTSIQNGLVNLECANIDSIKVEIFEIDLEVLFSLYPFLSNEFDQLVFSQPHHTLNYPVPKTTHVQSIPVALPEEFAKKNLIIKVRYV